MSRTQSIASIGQLCAWLQRSPVEIREAAKLAGVSPVMRINSVDHFDESDIPAIRDHLKPAEPSDDE